MPGTDRAIVPGTDRAINTRACPIHLVYRRAEGDGRASKPIGAEQTNQCQALIATVDGQDVRRTREGRPDPSIRRRQPVLYDGMSQTPPLAVYTEKPAS